MVLVYCTLQWMSFTHMVERQRARGKPKRSWQENELKLAGMGNNQSTMYFTVSTVPNQAVESAALVRLACKKRSQKPMQIALFGGRVLSKPAANQFAGPIT